MVQLTQIFIIYICVAFARSHMFFGNDHRHSGISQMISDLITQNLGNSQSYGPGKYRPGLPWIGNNFGSPSFDYNRPSNILGENLFGSPDYTGHEGVFSSEESGEPLQQPNSGKEVQNIQIPQIPSISSGANFDLTSNVNSANILPNEQNVDFTGQGIVDNINVDVPNIEIPQIEGIVGGLYKKPVNGIVGSNLGAQAEDSPKVDLNKPGTTTYAVGPIIGQLEQLNSVAGNVNVEGNKHTIGSSVATSDQDNIKDNLNSSSDSKDDNNLHVNVPVDRVVTDSKLEDIINNIFKTVDGQGILNVGIDEPKANVSGISSQDISNSDIPKVLDVPMNKYGKLTQIESSVADNLQANNSTSIVKDESNQDSTLKINQVAPAGDNLHIKVNKHKDVSSIVFPDQLREAKDKMQKEKNVSQLSKLNDMNGFDNGQVLYAVNIGSSIVPQDQGYYVSPTSSVNDQQVIVNSPSGTSVQYVPQNPGNIVSSTVPSGNIISTNANEGSTNGGYILVNGPANGNSNSGQASYYPSTSSAGQPNIYYQVPSNPTQQSYHTVQLSNGQIALVPVNTGQYVQNIGQGQVTGLHNGQQYMPVQSTSQILYSNGQQLVPSNFQPMQGSNQYMTTSNSQQYVPSSSQPMQGNGQILVASNGQQYVQASAQPAQGNGQILVQGNGQQYVQASAQPAQGNGQILVQGNGQQYMQSNDQPANGQFVVLSNGQNYVPNDQVTLPWSQSTGQNNGQIYVPISNQNAQSNVMAVPAGSIVTVGGNSNNVPLMVFKEQAETSPTPSSSDDDDDDEIDQEKDEVVEELKKNTVKDKQ